ncbi:endonuclease domain of the non-LTR retrotransposon LINE-1 [Elysia marginata]|uniref:Endonuclease domain of the non-LTR retrotransposon LINE-1 n=1 Tax=Elysia marginata TaxID=1093978 RepID=A0AAV4F0H5_9GAST|nr:endonuclease domain of the non-LTR retrotransposon LINE-1 [Elysia marginata]
MIGLAILYILVLRLTIQTAILNYQNNIAFNNKGQHMHLSVKPAHLIHTLADENFNGTVRVVTTTTEKRKQTRRKHRGGTCKTLSVRPYYLLREFSHVPVTAVYIHSRLNYTQASETSSHIHDIQTQSPDAFIIVAGDFNDCPRETLLPFLHQLVDTPTRGDNCLDLLFTNIPNSHVCQKLWALGNSDHSLVYLRPKYTPMRHRENNPNRKQHSSGHQRFGMSCERVLIAQTGICL